MGRLPNRPKLKEPQAIKSVLGDILERAGLKAAVDRQRVIVEWPQIVSPAIARHATAERVSGPILHVATDSSVWMNELAAIKPVLLEKVNACLAPGPPLFTDIRFVQRSRVGRSPKAPLPPQDTPLSEDDLRAAEEVLAPVKDDQLRSILRSILHKDMQLKRLRSRDVNSPTHF